MRIFTTSLGTETNTFSPIAIGWSAFQELGIYHYGEPLERRSRRASCRFG
jgi:microcystin degradation protein MlrC